MSEPSVLMVPVHIDALVLRQDRAVVDALADFTRLPYSDGRRDVNSDIGYLSEAILTDPFANQSLRLPAGVHLHWALPDALTRATAADGGMAFPVVPNRWLVLRGQSGQAGYDAGWVVESDYLHPESAGAETGSATYPVDPGLGGVAKPFRHLGRVVPLAEWTADAPAERLAELTAVGYGEPTFAAFYPNCRNVFGLYDGDPSISTDGLRGMRYDIVGWYADGGQDYLTGLQHSVRWGGLEQATREVARWAVTLPVDAAYPTRMLCFGRLTFAPSGELTSVPPVAAPVTVAVGNSGPQALCAYLGDAVGGTDQLTAEEQLEAMLLAPTIEQGELDLGARFTQALHESGFVARAAGTLWTLRQESSVGAADAVQAGRRSAMSAALPEELTPALDRLEHALNALNVAQQAYDQATDEIGSLGDQLFADWYRYMICAYPPAGTGEDYPDIDEVRLFIERRVLSELQTRVLATGLVENVPDSGGAVTPTAVDTNPNAAAAAVALAAGQVRAALAQLNGSPGVADAGLVYRVQPVEAPRFWEPAEPAVLLAGAAMSPTLRHGQDGRMRSDGLLDCHAVTGIPATPATADEAAGLSRVIDSLAATDGQDQIGFRTWTEQDWHAQLLSWAVEALPIPSGPGGDYPPDYLTSTHRLADDEPELRLRDDQGTLSAAATVYSGTSILTPYAQNLQVRRLAGYVTGIYQQELGLPAMSDDEAVVFLADAANLATVQAWLATKPSGPTPDPVATALRALEHLQTTPSLSQSLGGFNEALLTRRQTLQLDVADPLGFDDYRRFSATVRPFVQGPAPGEPAPPGGVLLPPYLRGHNRSAAAPLGTFQPVRSGALRVRRLRLLDAFGRVLDLQWDRVVASRLLPASADGDLISLPPRFVQPARLGFRWLSADLGDVQLTELASHTPICGWVLPNHLEESLMFFRPDGVALGSIDRGGRWQYAPGGVPVAPDQVVDQHLRGVITHLLGTGAAFLQNFHGAIDSALENIDPPNLTRQQETAVLIGRPLAIVRASVDLQLQGPPAVDQTWTALRRDLRSDTRQTAAVSGVQVPVRIGDFRQLGDGLVGFWQETADGLDITFNAPLSDPIDDPHIRTHADGEIAVLQSPGSPAHTLTMLVDPRGAVHATCGVLPVKTIDIPAEQYTDALGRIEVTFTTGPILSSPHDVEVPLPTEQEHTWSWVEVAGSGWRRTWAYPTVDRQGFLDGLALALWARLVDRGVQWLQPTDETSAQVVAVADRAATTLAPWSSTVSAALEQVLGPPLAAATPIALADFGTAVAPAIGLPAWTRLAEAGVGWLVPVGATDGGADLARVSVGEAGAAASLPDPFTGMEDLLRSVLDRAQRRILQPGPAPGPRSNGAPQIREGWLSLRRLEQLAP
jgi:hypothetical protein